ncbi:hypothetical protein VPH35_085662 [Triticum aestivum]
MEERVFTLQAHSLLSLRSFLLHWLLRKRKTKKRLKESTRSPFGLLGGQTCTTSNSFSKEDRGICLKKPSWNYVTVSRSLFTTTFGHRGDIGEGLECWRGYHQSLRPTQMGLSLNIDISATSFFKSVTVVQFVLEFLNLRDASRPLTDRDRVKIKKALRGVRVETNHQEDQIRRYKITGITPVPMSQLIFPVDERGTRMSVVQYFMQRYNYNLQYTSWLCLQSGSDAWPVYLPMEACKIVEGQRYSKKLNDKQVTNILRTTCQRPQQREQSIREMVLHNKYAEDKFAQEFEINVCSDLVSVPARVLPPPMLRYHDSGKEKTCAPSVGQWNMINKKMINGGIIDNWACVSFSRIPPEEVHRFCCDLIQMCNMTGMSVNPRPLVDNRSASPNHIENALRDVYRRTTEMLGKQGNEKQLQLLIVILPEVSGSYGKIKKVCETDLGIVSQCCLPRHAARPNKQYLENVALKINVKVGGRNTVLERAFVRNGIPFVSEVPTIIFGADVTHPPPGEDSASSIAAVVASMDWPEITKYSGLVSAQPHRELLIASRWNTGRRPERILFYRDGVSEGQFSHVLLHEMDAIRKACASLEEGYMPPVTFVIVRHHARLDIPEVPGRCDMTDKSGDILLGTLADKSEFDFYLCNNAGTQGTSSSTHYHVLYDENHFTADALKSLTNDLCYTSTCRTRAVSVVTPAYYAHLKGIIRARYYVEGDSLNAGLNPRISGQSLPKILLLGGCRRRQVRREPSPIPPELRVPLTTQANLWGHVQKHYTFPDVWVFNHHEIEGQEEDVNLIDDAGCIMALALTRTFVDAQDTQQSWNGKISMTDFMIINGIPVLRTPPPFKGNDEMYIKDKCALKRILRLIFLRYGGEFQYMERFLNLLNDPVRVLQRWAREYIKNPMVFKTTDQKGKTVIGIFKMYNGLSDDRKARFRTLVHQVRCPFWPAAKNNYHLLPIVLFRWNVFGKEYTDNSWGCFQCLTNYEVHGKTVSSLNKSFFFNKTNVLEIGSLFLA